MIHEQYVTGAPTPQNMIDLVSGWVSQLPPEVPVEAGAIPLFSDGRVDWALERLGGVFGANVLELGPLEGAHTYQLLRRGAQSVVAIEANKLAFMRCLIVKELLGLDRVSFQLGDFVPYVAETSRRYDILWASGILYHMPDPVGVLVNMSRVSDRIFLWTHYVDDEEMPITDPRRSPIVGTESVSWRGHNFNLYRRTYFDQANVNEFCGGIESAPAWMEKQDILTVLQELGYAQIDVLPGDPNHGAGPNFCVLATR